MIRALIAGVASLALAGMVPVRADDLRGTWVNPERTVVVRIEDCGRALCGRIVQAAPTAQADARESGYPQLLGLRIMTDYRPAGSNHWRGRVLVPDLGNTFSSHVDLIDAQHARIAGCLIGQYLCKSQVWLRR